MLSPSPWIRRSVSCHRRHRSPASPAPGWSHLSCLLPPCSLSALSCPAPPPSLRPGPSLGLFRPYIAPTHARLVSPFRDSHITPAGARVEKQAKQAWAASSLGLCPVGPYSARSTVSLTLYLPLVYLLATYSLPVVLCPARPGKPSPIGPPAAPWG
ncbi:hypothetical protein B0T11DRAFT_9493 [Plectosphaerella cucumerina]|uniref:Uncharacterized protein n=1 Tax=Plectosphaerella cucumerina TaxID=40658 RepID=A0A8K0TS76_9PEZI|nr:hypothetical protein B0T11DRAFT_9493 [Plectosphaerella cucumerina]